MHYWSGTPIMNSTEIVAVAPSALEPSALEPSTPDP
jgi:hypothetical protein